MNIIEKLNWRYAVKSFVPQKMISDSNIQQLIEITRLSASSLGIQPYKLIVIKDQTTKDKLAGSSLGSNPDKVREASHIIVFAIETIIDRARMDHHIEFTAKVRNQSIESLQGYSETIKFFINKKLKKS